jgi:hypothetical protein
MYVVIVESKATRDFLPSNGPKNIQHVIKNMSGRFKDLKLKTSGSNESSLEEYIA